MSVEIIGTKFGAAYHFPEIRTGLMVVFLKDGRGRTPVSLLLPHQLYVESVERLLASAGPGVAVEVCPVRGSEFIEVKKKGL